jgi:phospholipase C
MTTGSTQGVTDNLPPEANPITGPSIFAQVDPSWKVYADAMRSDCSQTSGHFEHGTKYVVRHNPAAYMVSPPLNAPDRDCSVNDVPMGNPDSGELSTDLSSGSLPRFSLVVPGLCHNMGEPVDGPACDPSNPISAGDNWLSQWMPTILDSPDYMSDRLVVFLTWDRGAGETGGATLDCLDPDRLLDPGCHIPTLVFSTGTRGGTENSTFFSHYSMLKTTEELLGLPTSALGANVSEANSMRDAFNLVPAVLP